jgi:azurin
MKIRLLSISVLVALLAAGCAKNEAPKAATSPNTQTSSAPATAPTATQAKADPAKSSTAPAASTSKAPAGAPRVIEITANDQMKFSLTTIEAKAGEQLKVVLTNVGTLPKEAMGHNWVLLKAGTDGNAFSAAAITAKDKDYIPDSMKDSVIAHTALLGPRKSDEVSFTVPPAGEYPFICSFPAHFAVGMKGTLISK